MGSIPLHLQPSGEQLRLLLGLSRTRPKKPVKLEDAKAIRTGDMIPTLVKAIQEQQAQIESLKAEVEALKNG